MRAVIVAGALGLLCGCVSTSVSQVRPYSPDEYTVTGRALMEDGDHYQAALAAANKFCASRSKSVLEEEAEVETQDNGLPSTVLYFQCLAEDDPALAEGDEE